VSELLDPVVMEEEGKLAVENEEEFFDSRNL
jgi:hypothetical protein